MPPKKLGSSCKVSKHHKDMDIEARFSSGVGTLQGWHHVVSEDRVIEDVICLGSETKLGLFGVVDGHGGGECATFVAKNLPLQIETQVSQRRDLRELMCEAWGSLLEDSFIQVARDWDEQGLKQGGAVATLAVVADRSCLIAHAGDCKVIASLPGGSFAELTRDHRCSDPEEAERVMLAEGQVRNGRVEGRLVPSRAFGNIDVRTRPNGVVLDCIAPEPDICFHTVEKEIDGFLIIASDGLFDSLSPAQAVSHVRSTLEEGYCASDAADRLIQFVGRSRDDVSVIILSFRKE